MPLTFATAELVLEHDPSAASAGLGRIVAVAPTLMLASDREIPLSVRDVTVRPAETLPQLIVAVPAARPVTSAPLTVATALLELEQVPRVTLAGLAEIVVLLPIVIVD